MGSRSGRGSKVAWLVRGTRLRAWRPSVSRTEGWTHGRAVHTSPDGGSGAQASLTVAGGADLRAMDVRLLEGATTVDQVPLG